MSPYLMTRNTKRGVMAGYPENVLVLPEPHRIAVQTNYQLDDELCPFPMGQALREWSASVELLPELDDYVANFKEFLRTKFLYNPETPRRMIANFMYNPDFRIDQDLDGFTYDEDKEDLGTALDNFYENNWPESHSADEAAEVAQNFPRPSGNTNSPLGSVMAQVLNTALNLADPVVKDSYRAEYGDLGLEIIEKHGTAILFDEINASQLDWKVGFLGVGETETQPLGTHVSFGGVIGDHCIWESREAFNGLAIANADTKLWRGSPATDLEDLCQAVGRNFATFGFDPLEPTKHLARARHLASMALELELDPDRPITLVSITKQEVQKH